MAPKAIVLSVCGTAVFGFAYILALLFSIQARPCRPDTLNLNSTTQYLAPPESHWSPLSMLDIRKREAQWNRMAEALGMHVSS